MSKDNKDKDKPKKPAVFTGVPSDMAIITQTKNNKEK